MRPNITHNVIENGMQELKRQKQKDRTSIAGKNISRIRKSKNEDESKVRKLTREALASLCGVSASNLCRTECGKQSPSAETLRKLAEALCVNVDTLLTARDEEEGAPGG